MFSEDLTVFFSDFAETASWDDIEGKVLIDTPDDLIIDGMVLTHAPVMRFPSNQWKGIREGHRVRVGQKTYKLTQSPRRENDGAISFVEIVLC